MDKLIVTGMRFVEDQKPIQKLAVGQMTVLTLEQNNHGVDGLAYAVKDTAGNKLGYVRNQDLPELFRYTGKNAVITAYDIEAVRQNYLLLKRNPAITFKANAPEFAIKPTEQKTEIKKESKEMINTNSMRNQFFREVKNVAIDIQSGKFGISNADGISVFVDGTINVNPIQELGVKIPAFAMRIAVDQLKAGDIVINGDDASFFVESVKEGGYKVISTSGEVSTVGNVKNMFFGSNTVLAVKNMFEGSGMNPMMMALMMGDNNGTGKMDMKTLALMSMMGGMGGEAGGMNPMMLMMLMADK